MTPLHWKAATAAAGQVTVNAYTDIDLVTGLGGNSVYFRAETSGPLSVYVTNAGAASIKYKVIGSNDPLLADANWAEALAEVTVAAAGVSNQTVALAYYTNYKIQAKSAVTDTPGTLVGSILQKRV